ncbi:beta-galactosidase/beta-glucuronidase [Ruminococcaceae bacterium R-25]|nr:beta-galactosidase/beta-glucuronidase [Ruminococcaceae bacterium R-25]SUQ10877.1 Beta-galactosidase/beta-glucuronidase [Oscillospiraceae bacterium]
MEFTYSNDGFLPYSSFDYIFSERQMPEFGKVASPFMKPLKTWKFYLANGQSEIPFGVMNSSFDDSDWPLVNCPSTWQTEGFGLPQNLIYDYPERLAQDVARKEETISDKYVLKSVGNDDDEVGIYRTTVVFNPSDIDRALYLETSGICGSFKVFINDKLLCNSHAVFTRKRLLISGLVRAGVNQITIIVNRYDRDDDGHIILDMMNFGFSGIFRPIMIVEDSLLELSNLHLQLEYVPSAYISEVAKMGQIATRSSVSRVPHGDFMIKVDFAMRNHTNYMIPYSVRISLLEARAEYDPYKLPFVNIKGQSEPVVGVVDALKETRASTDFVAIDVAQWSDCTPVQYDIVFEVMDSEGKVICAKKKRFGFRTTEIVQDKLNINDRRVNLMLVKYYEFDPQNGIAVSLDRMRQDIILMKRAGINGVIADGMPLSDEFLNLCDQYGMYVIATSADFYMRDYVESAMNHPSVVMWGFQKYHFNYELAHRVKHECLRIDNTRPWYCEAVIASAANKKAKPVDRISDIKPLPSEAGAVFGPWEDLCLDRKKIFDLNRTGRNLFETIPGRTRFTDDDTPYKWIHHADLVGGKQKENSCIGQGIVDAERNPHPIYLDIKKQCQSIAIFATAGDPATLTMRNSNQFGYTDELDLEWKILLGGRAIMSGRGMIPEIEPFGSRTLKFPFATEVFTTPGWAQGKAEFIEMYMNALSKEVVFDITLKLHKDTYYAKAGYEVAFYQDVLTDNIASPVAEPADLAMGLRSGEKAPSNESAMQLGSGKKDPDSALLDTGVDLDQALLTEEDSGRVERMTDNKELTGFTERFDSSDAPMDEKLVDVITHNAVYTVPHGLYVGKGDLKIGFGRNPGSLESLEIAGYNFLKGPLAPSFYRCPSNIDRTDRSFVLARTVFSKESDYEHIQESIKFVGSEYGSRDGEFTMISRYKSFAMHGEVIVFYEVPRADTLRVTLDFKPKYDMVRYGIRFPIVKDDCVCSWYGRGPGESYVDRKNAARLGVYSAGAGKIYHPYARPAENSSHTDTQVVKITNGDGDSIEIRRIGYNPKFDFTVLPYTPEQMNEFLHEEQLMNNDFCEFFCDFAAKEIERTKDNITSQPVKKDVKYRETFEIRLVPGQRVIGEA